MTRRFLSKLFSPIGVLILFGLALAAATWYLGPLVSIGNLRPFDRPSHRLIALAGIAATTTIAILILLLRRRAREQAMTQAITDSAAASDARDAAVEAELAELRGRMGEALGMLRKSKLGGRFGSRHLYQLPWYIVIGPPAPARPPRSSIPG